MKKLIINHADNTIQEVELTAEEITLRNNIHADEIANRPSAFELSMANLRAKRDAKLAETDYLALSDNTLSAEMTTYRQALRDITNDLETVADVEAVIFPTKP